MSLNAEQLRRVDILKSVEEMELDWDSEEYPPHELDVPPLPKTPDFLNIKNQTINHDEDNENVDSVIAGIPRIDGIRGDIYSDLTKRGVAAVVYEGVVVTKELKEGLAVEIQKETDLADLCVVLKPWQESECYDSMENGRGKDYFLMLVNAATNNALSAAWLGLDNESRKQDFLDQYSVLPSTRAASRRGILFQGKLSYFHDREKEGIFKYLPIDLVQGPEALMASENQVVQKVLARKYLKRYDNSPYAPISKIIQQGRLRDRWG